MVQTGIAHAGFLRLYKLFQMGTKLFPYRLCFTGKIPHKHAKYKCKLVAFYCYFVISFKKITDFYGFLMIGTEKKEASNSVLIRTHPYPSVPIRTHPYSSVLIRTNPYSSVLIRTHPYSSVPIRTHPYSSVLIRTHPYQSVLIRTHPYSSVLIRTHPYKNRVSV